MVNHESIDFFVYCEEEIEEFDDPSWNEMNNPDRLELNNRTEEERRERDTTWLCQVEKGNLSIDNCCSVFAQNSLQRIDLKRRGEERISTSSFTRRPQSHLLHLFLPSPRQLSKIPLNKSTDSFMHIAFIDWWTLTAECMKMKKKNQHFNCKTATVLTAIETVGR